MVVMSRVAVVALTSLLASCGDRPSVYGKKRSVEWSRCIRDHVETMIHGMGVSCEVRTAPDTQPGIEIVGDITILEIERIEIALSEAAEENVWPIFFVWFRAADEFITRGRMPGGGGVTIRHDGTLLYRCRI